VKKSGVLQGKVLRSQGGGRVKKKEGTIRDRMALARRNSNGYWGKNYWVWRCLRYVKKKKRRTSKARRLSLWGCGGRGKKRNRRASSLAKRRKTALNISTQKKIGRNGEKKE